MQVRATLVHERELKATRIVRERGIDPQTTDGPVRVSGGTLLG